MKETIQSFTRIARDDRDFHSLLENVVNNYGYIGKHVYAVLTIAKIFKGRNTAEC